MNDAQSGEEENTVVHIHTLNYTVNIKIPYFILYLYYSLINPANKISIKLFSLFVLVHSTCQMFFLS